MKAPKQRQNTASQTRHCYTASYTISNVLFIWKYYKQETCTAASYTLCLGVVRLMLLAQKSLSRCLHMFKVPLRLCCPFCRTLSSIITWSTWHRYETTRTKVCAGVCIKALQPSEVCPQEVSLYIKQVRHEMVKCRGGKAGRSRNTWFNANIVLALPINGKIIHVRADIRVALRIILCVHVQ